MIFFIRFYFLSFPFLSYVNRRKMGPNIDFKGNTQIAKVVNWKHSYIYVTQKRRFGILKSLLVAGSTDWDRIVEPLGKHHKDLLKTLVSHESIFPSNIF